MKFNPFKDEVKLSPKTETHPLREEDIVNSQKVDEKTRSESRYKDAQTTDLKTNTGLKIALSVFICLLIVFWFYFLSSTVGEYLAVMYQQQEVVPESVIVAIITAGSSVIALMGFILKGLFGSK